LAVAEVNGSERDDRTWRLAGSISDQSHGRRRVLCLIGEIDGVVVDQFETSVDGRYPAVDAIDAGAATFLGSAGLRLLLRVRDSSLTVGRSAVLRASSAAVDRVLQRRRPGRGFRTVTRGRGVTGRGSEPAAATSARNARRSRSLATFTKVSEKPLAQAHRRIADAEHTVERHMIEQAQRTRDPDETRRRAVGISRSAERHRKVADEIDGRDSGSGPDGA
jgi:anti-anti-sigma regulatory factor